MCLFQGRGGGGMWSLEDPDGVGTRTWAEEWVSQTVRLVSPVREGPAK